jgi:hypothetical protein
MSGATAGVAAAFHQPPYVHAKRHALAAMRPQNITCQERRGLLAHAVGPARAHRY